MRSFFNKKLKVFKWKQIKDTAKFSYEEVDGEFPCNIQGATPEETQMFQGQIGSIFSCFTTVNCPAEESDKVTIEDSNHKVKGVKVSDFGSVPFKKLILVKQDAD